MRFRFQGHAVHVVERGASNRDVVVLHHGLLMSAADWDSVGFIDRLAERHWVWAIDSFGHGQSADVESDDLHGRDARADLVVALAEERGVAAFHFVGYSMGGWIGGALAQRYRDRLRSVSIGGWDVNAGLATAKRWTKETLGVDLDFDLLVAVAEPTLPEVTAGSAARVHGWRETWARMSVPPHDLDRLSALDVPLHLWCGQNDAYYPAMEQAANELGVRFDRLEGDHMTASLDPAAASAVGEFLREIER